jgi:lauroyl/myristoyl acyltransferase
MILSFMHHHRYDGMFASLKRHGADLHILMLAEVLAKDAPEPVRQHCRVVRRGGTIQSTEGGTAAILEILKPGVTLAIASDVASQTEVEFLGRRVRGAFGAARIAAQTNSPVVIVTSVRDGDDVLNGHYLKVHEPLEPADFAGPEELLNELLAVHGEAILAWPEAHDIPLARFMPIEDGDTGSV